MSAWDSYWQSYWNWEKVFRKITSEVYFSLINEYCDSLEGKKIIELGCGTGLTSAKLAEYGADVTLIDSSEDALRIAEKNFKTIGVEGKFIYGNVFDLPGSEFTDQFDIVFSEGLVEHFLGNERQKIFDIHSKLAKKNGMVFIAIPNIYNLPRRILSEFTDRFLNKENRIWINIPQEDLNSSELVDRMNSSGLKTTEITGILFQLSHLTLFYLVGFFPLVPYLLFLLKMGPKLVNIEETGIKKNSLKPLMLLWGGRDFFNRTLGYEVVAIGRK